MGEGKRKKGKKKKRQHTGTSLQPRHGIYPIDDGVRVASAQVELGDGGCSRRRCGHVVRAIHVIGSLLDLLLVALPEIATATTFAGLPVRSQEPE